MPNKPKPKRSVSFPPMVKPKKKPSMKETAAKKVKKPSRAGGAALATASELQRREMARTRLQKPDRMAAAAARKKAAVREREMENQRRNQRGQARMDSFNRRSGKR
jgi:hypothetical protein